MAARLLTIVRSIRWMATSLVANRDQLPTPQGMWDTVSPTIDVFGTERYGNVQVERITDVLGSIEMVFSKVPPDTLRFYISMGYQHNDAGVSHGMAPGRIVPIPGLFPFLNFGDAEVTPSNQLRGVSNFYVPPDSFAAVRTIAMGAAARMFGTALFFDMPVGEYTAMGRD